MKLGPNVKHILDCHECNEEVISRTRSHTMTYRQQIVCPLLIPLSKAELINYEKQNGDLVK